MALRVTFCKACDQEALQVCLVLDQRERFGNHLRSTLGAGRIDKHNEAVRQLTALGVEVLVSKYKTLPTVRQWEGNTLAVLVPHMQHNLMNGCSRMHQRSERLRLSQGRADLGM